MNLTTNLNAYASKMPCIDELVTLYVRLGFGNNDIISLLAHKHSVVGTIRTLKWKFHGSPVILFKTMNVTLMVALKRSPK